MYSQTKFKKGDLIGEFRYTEAIYETKFSIFVDDEHYRSLGILKYANHSFNPNAKVEFPEMRALRDIKAHEEIVWDYQWERL